MRASSRTRETADRCGSGVSLAGSVGAVTYGRLREGRVPLPDRADCDSASDAGAYVRLLPRGVQRRGPNPAGGPAGRGERLSHRGAASGDHRSQEPRGSGLAWRGRVGGVGAIGAGCASSSPQLHRLDQWPTFGSEDGPATLQVPQRQLAVLSTNSQRICNPAERSAVPGEDRRGDGALVAGTAFSAIVSNDHSGTRWTLLRLIRGRSWAETAGSGRSGGRGRSRNHQVGDGRHHSGHVLGGCQPESPCRQAAQARAFGAREGSSSQGREESSKISVKGGSPARAGGAGSAGLPSQAGSQTRSREPSDLRRGSECGGHGAQQAFGLCYFGRRLGSVHPSRDGEGGTVWAHNAQGKPVVSVVEKMQCVWCRASRTATQGPRLDLQMWFPTRSGSQRSDQHSRRRAGGENIRLWSSCKTSRWGGWER